MKIPRGFVAVKTIGSALDAEVTRQYAPARSTRSPRLCEFLSVQIYRFHIYVHPLER